MREVGELVDDQADRLDGVGPWQGADAGRERHAGLRDGSRAVLEVEVMVAEPTTRVPS